MSQPKSFDAVRQRRSTLRHPNEVIADLADRQFGQVARRQLLAAGVSDGAVRHRLETGALVETHRGVYSVGLKPMTREARFMAAVLAAGVDAVLSHGSAAAHLGIRGYGGGPIHVSAPHKVCRDRRIIGHQTRLPPDEVTVLDAIPATGLSRTLFDVAATAGPTAFHSALRQAEYLRLTDALALHDLLERYPRRRGGPIIRTALESKRFGAVRTGSTLELDFLAFLDARCLPLPETNTFIEAGPRTYEADCAWRSDRVIAELDDPHSHTTDHAFESDRLRDRRLLLAGWQTIRITRAMLDHDPDELERDLRALLRR